MKTQITYKGYDALRKEIEQLKKDSLEFKAQCYHKDETISVLETRIAETQADNRVLDKALDLACEYLCESMFRIPYHRRLGDRNMREEEWKNRFINEAQMPEGGEGN